MACPYSSNDQQCFFTENQTKEHLLHHIKNKIPTCLPFANRTLLPNRHELFSMINKPAQDETKEAIAKREPLLFMPNDIQEPNVYDYGLNVYKPYLIGILPCGTKTTIILENVPVYFDIKLPDYPTLMATEPLLASRKNDAFIDLVKAGAVEQGIKIRDSNVIQLLPSRGFHLTTHPYLRLFFSDLQSRMKAYEMVKKLAPDAETASDDKTSFGRVSYFAMVAREYKFNTADWNQITRYSVVNGKTNCEYTFSVDIKDFMALDDKVRDALPSHTKKLLDFDNAVIGQWDIETNGELPDYKPAESAGFAKARHFDTSKFNIFMMNTSFFQQWNTDAMYEVCCVDVSLNIDKLASKSGNEKNTLISIICHNESEVLRANMYIWSQVQPEFLGGFNTAGFDWPLYREKLWKLELLGDLKRGLSAIKDYDKSYDNDFVYERSFIYNRKMKIAADRDHFLICSAKFPGVLDTDCLPNFLKLYTRAEIPKMAALNFFLKANKLESKEDMPYKRMWKIYERARALTLVPQKCHCNDINSGHNKCECCSSIIPAIDCLENEEYDNDDPRRYTTTLHSDIAGKCCHCGKRPRNLADMELVAIYCRIDCQRPQELNVKRSIIGDKRELANLSFTPLYNAFVYADGEKVCNMMGAYCYDYGVAFSNIKLNKGDHEKDWNVGGFVVTPKRGLYKTPITGLDFESLYPSLIATYNLSPDMIITDKEFAQCLESKGYTLHPITDESETHLTFNRGEKKNDPSNEVFKNIAWSVRHNGILTKNDTHITTGYSKKYEPIYGREALPQERMGYMAHIVKSLKELRRPVKAQFVKFSKEFEVLEKRYDELNEANFASKEEYLKARASSNSIKVLNNTFYGQVSQYKNSYYDINIAGGITSAGRKNLKMVKRFVESKGFFIAYGDTDSLYIACPQEVFSGITATYGTEEYFTDMVKIAMKVMQGLADDVFAELVRDNGTLFLRMAYEEVGLFCVMCGKKKYYMIPHTETINFRPSELFIRGLELKKQGQTPISKELQMKFLWTSMDLANGKELIDIAVDIVKSFFTTNQDPAKFAKMHTYRPHKKNVSVLRFIERMRQRGVALPDPGDKFRTVVIRKEQSYTTRGTMEKNSVGDKMEYLHEVQSKGYQLDMTHYLEGTIYGAFARFIAYHPSFQKEGLNMEDPIEYKIGDAYSVKEATKFLKKVCSEYINSGLDVMSPQERGRQLQREYKLSVKAISGSTQYTQEIKGMLAKKTVGGIIPSTQDGSHPALFIEKLRQNIKSSHELAFAQKFVSVYGKDIFALKKRFDRDYKVRLISFGRIESRINDALMKLLPQSWKISDDYNRRIAEGVESVKSGGEPVLVELSDADKRVIDEVSATLAKFQSAIYCKLNMMAIAKVIEEEVVKKTGTEYTPRLNAREMAVSESKQARIIPAYTFG
jgi:DNA polymerase elongation subunit (family B)